MDNIKGHIITNSFLNTKKYTEHYEWLKASASKYSAGLEVLEMQISYVLIHQAGKKSFLLLLMVIHLYYTGTRI